MNLLLSVLSIFLLQSSPELVGIVTGQVFADGKPAVGMQVVLFQPTYDRSGNKTYRIVKNVEVDDRGVYRIFAVNPGIYYLGVDARRRSNSRVTVGTELQRQTLSKYGTVYYGSTTDLTHAAQVTVKAQEETKADFSLMPQLMSQVNGRFVYPPPDRPSRLHVSFNLDSPMERGSSELNTRQFPFTPEGTFELTNLAPGKYWIMARLESSPDPKVRGELPHVFATATAAVEIRGGEFVNVVLKPWAETLAATITVDGGPISSLHGYELIQMVLEPSDLGHTGILPSVPTVTPRISEEGSIRFQNVAHVDYNLRITGLPTTVYVKKITFGETPVARNAIHVTESDQSLTVFLMSGAGSVTGFVRAAGGAVYPNAWVVLLREGSDGTDQVPFVRPDASGAFAISNIMPGKYRLFACDLAYLDQFFDPEFIQRHKDDGQSVNISEESRVSTDVTLSGLLN